jgi:hypothetical protein
VFEVTFLEFCLSLTLAEGGRDNHANLLPRSFANALVQTLNFTVNFDVPITQILHHVQDGREAPRSEDYKDDSLTDQIHAQAPYAAKGQRTQRNERDGIFRHGGEQLMLQLTQDAQGYVGKFDIGLQIT